MKKIKLLFTLLFAVSLSLNAQSKKQELKFKKAVSTFTKKVKKIEDRDRKEIILESFVTKLNQEYKKSNVENLSKENQKQLKVTLDKVNNGLASVRAGNHTSLNSYAEFIESEFNQANDNLAYLGLLALFTLLLFFI
jgi:hypothetical protein|tara:strand:- start:96 stop:506 length:411 start_codon:yes stop_codon:yes gene_type:complete